MSITTKLRNVVNAQAALQELGTYKPKAKFGYDCGKLIRECTAELELFSKARQATVEAYGAFDSEKGAYSFMSQAAQKGLGGDTTALLDTEIVFQISELPYADVEKLEPTAGLLANLQWAMTKSPYEVDPPVTPAA